MTDQEAELIEAWEHYLARRKEKKFPITDRIKKRLLEKLELFSGGNISKKIEICDKASLKPWSDFYEIKEDKPINKVTELVNDLNDVRYNPKYPN